VLTAWEDFVARERKLSSGKVDPKLVCIDLQPYQTVQAHEREDILNIGGFSDAVFNVISAFLENNDQRFVAEVEAMTL
jgi:60 kDa SS-A/Ro ribonucleoprotein